MKVYAVLVYYGYAECVDNIIIYESEKQANKFAKEKEQEKRYSTEVVEVEFITLEKGDKMCPHNNFEIVYYKDGVMLRQCRNCNEVEVRLDDTWVNAEAVKEALEWWDCINY